METSPNNSPTNSPTNSPELEAKTSAGGSPAASSTAAKLRLKEESPAGKLSPNSNGSNGSNGRVMDKEHSIKRASVKRLDEMLGQTIPVTDEGFIRVIDYMGDDSAIVQAARISYGEGTKSSRGDRGLIRYLMRNRHTTPFEMCELKLHIRIPIFVARQWMRHRTASINEYSARYSVTKESYHIPSASDLAGQSAANGQMRSEDQPIDKAAAESIISKLEAHSKQAFELYHELLADEDDKEGIARELARIPLPLNTMTELYWKIDLHNLLHFLALRMHPHAQPEIRVYAEAIAEVVKLWTPTAYEAFEEYHLKSASLSRSALKLVREALNNKAARPITKPEDMSKSEWATIAKLLDIE